MPNTHIGIIAASASLALCLECPGHGDSSAPLGKLAPWPVCKRVAQKKLSVSFTKHPHFREMCALYRDVCHECDCSRMVMRTELFGWQHTCALGLGPAVKFCLRRRMRMLLLVMLLSHALNIVTIFCPKVQDDDPSSKVPYTGVAD